MPRVRPPLAIAGAVATGAALWEGRRARRRPPALGRLLTELPPGRHPVGPFLVVAAPDHLAVVPSGEPDHVIWSTVPGAAFVAAARADRKWRERHGHFVGRDLLRRRLVDQTVQAVVRDGEAVVVEGRLIDRASEVGYRLRFEPVDDVRLRLVLEVDPAGGPPVDRVSVVTARAPGAAFGYGEQFTYVDLDGRLVPILVREQGVGRGAQPLTFIADRRSGSGGAWDWTYAAMPIHVGADRRSFFLRSSRYAEFDLRHGDVLRVELDGEVLDGEILHGHTPAELLEARSRHGGRQRPPADWIHDGAIVGLQGGSARVEALVERIEDAGVPLAGVFLQDWCGQRVTDFGDRLWWHWTLDRERYPRWAAMRDRWAADGIRILTYVNTFVCDPVGRGSLDRNLFAEAVDAGFVIRRPDGHPYLQDQGQFEAVQVDLTNPSARAWYRDVIVEEVLGVGASGFMADFGEELPFDAVLHDGDPAMWHNRWPEAWAELVDDAFVVAGRSEDAVAFFRSAFTRSPRWARLFWAGDQTVDWSVEDGIASAVTGILSGGLSGMLFNHSDIGGYTAVRTPVRSWVRSPELLRRWSELAAFGVMFRTHEGNRPRDNAQIYDDEESLAHLASMARLFVALGPYRRAVIAECARSGLPYWRHPWIDHPDDPQSRAVRFERFQVGDDLLVAPVLTPKTSAVRTWLPEGRWTFLWDGRTIDGDRWVDAPAPMGRPPAWTRAGSDGERTIRESLGRAGFLA